MPGSAVAAAGGGDQAVPTARPKAQRAYVWWGRQIAVGVRALEDTYLLGRGSLGALLAVCACACGAALHLSTVPAIESNGLLAGSGPEPARFAACSKVLNATTAAQAMLFSAHFLLYNQRPEGHFIEQYNWTGRLAMHPADDEDAQGAALWALARFYREVRASQQRLREAYPKGLQTRLHEAVTRGVGFYEINSRQTKSGSRYIVYPGKATGQLALLAQVMLAMVEVKRALSSGPLPKGVNLNAPTFQQTSQAWRLDRSLREHADYLLRMRLPNGRFIRTYEASGRPRKQHTAKMHDAHCEGIALLALVHLVKYAGRGDLLHLAQHSARALVEAHKPTKLPDRQGMGVRGLEPEVRLLGPKDASVRFFRFGGLALAELADVADVEGSLLSSRDPLQDPPSSWAAKALLLGGWDVVEGLANHEKERKTGKGGEKGEAGAASNAASGGASGESSFCGCQKGGEEGGEDCASGCGGFGGGEAQFIEDVTAQKPAEWLDDEPLKIADPQARRPEGWEDDADGTWEPPLIANPRSLFLSLFLSFSLSLALSVRKNWSALKMGERVDSWSNGCGTGRSLWYR